MKKVDILSTTKLTKGFYLLLILLLASLGSFAQNMGVNATGAPPNANAGLDVDFADKGILIPRVALTGTANPDPLAAHVAGMIVYNTATAGDVTPGFYYNNGTRWVASIPSGNALGDMLYWNGSDWVRIPAGIPGQFLQFTSSSIPTWTGASFATITTTAASAVTGSSASTGGNITSDGGAAVLSRGVCYATTPNPTIANSILVAAPPTGIGSFTSNLTGLAPVTTYYVRAYATNSSVTTYGNQISFTTSAVLPTLAATTAASGITGNSANSGGNVTSSGGSTIIERGICYATTSNPTTANSKVIDGAPGVGSFISNITGLTGYTTYYVRAYAINGVGTAYGTQISFTTLVVPPTLTTVAASNITGASATSGGSMFWNGGGYSNYQNYGVAYSTTPGAVSPTYVATNTTNFPVNPNVNIAPWVTNITGLASNTTYYIRSYLNVYRSSPAGWVTIFGNELSFTTTAPTAPVMATTTAITNITASTASSGGTITSDGGSPITVKGVCWSTSPAPVLGTGNFTSNGSGNGAFGSSITGLSGSTTYYVRSYATNVVGTGYGPEQTFTTCVTPGYNIGDQVGGGTVFYVDCAGGGLISSMTDQSAGIAWGCSGTAMNTPAAIGTGSANTTTILNGCATRPIAASVARDYNGGGFSDWYLPSSLEMGQMMNQHTMLNLNGQYWTSTDNNSPTVAVMWYYISSIQQTGAVKTSNMRVRAIRSFAPPTLPVVTTDVVTNIGGASATSGGNVTDGGNANITARGVCWSIVSGPTLADSHTTDGTGTGTFVSSITGLTPGTLYYVRAYATNVVGTSYGNEVSFTTTAVTAPVITTEPVTNPTSTGCTSGGTIISDGGDPITVSGICWSEIQNPTTADPHTTDGTTSGTFLSDATGLTTGTTYYIRAYATNSVNTSYGNEIVYTPVLAGLPSVTTEAMVNLVGALAEASGTVVSDGGYAIIDQGVCWSESANPTLASNVVPDILLTPAGWAYTCHINGLTVGTTYHVRAYATNSIGTVYGDDLSFVATAATEGQIVISGLVYGVVFSVDVTGTHGLIANYGSIGDYDWGCPNTSTTATGTAIGDGPTNTDLIIADINLNSCETGQGFGPGWLAPEVIRNYWGPIWYFPSKDEFNLLWTNKGVDPDLDLFLTQDAALNSFWSSSEVSATEAWSFDGTNWINTSLKTDYLTVWTIMSF